jgi:hypothetical protein
LSCGQCGELDLEKLVRIEAHGGEVPGDFEGHETVQAAPDKDGAQGGRRVEVVWLRPGRQLGCEWKDLWNGDLSVTEEPAMGR